MAASSEAGQQIKIVLLGDGTTGKTSLATRISQNNFTKKYDQTLGVDFYLRRLELPGDKHRDQNLCVPLSLYFDIKVLCRLHYKCGILVVKLLVVKCLRITYMELMYVVCIEICVLCVVYV